MAVKLSENMPSATHKAAGLLRSKFVFAVTVLLLLTLGATAVYEAKWKRDLLERSQIEKAKSLGEFVALTSPEAIYAFDMVALDRYIQEISSASDISFAEIRNEKGVGMTTFRGMPSAEVPTLLKKIEQDDASSLMRFPIQDHGDLLGELILVVDHTGLRQSIKRNMLVQLLIYLCIILFLDLLLFFVFRVNVLQPLKALTRGASRVGKGDFRQPVEVSSADELGQLAICFNTMMEEIAYDRGELLSANKRLAAEIEHGLQVSGQLNLLSQAVEQSPVSVIITDPNGRIEYVNPQFTQMTGYDAEEVIGDSPLEADRVKSRQYYKIGLLEHMQGDVNWSGEKERRRRDGSVYWESVRLTSLYSGDGELSHYLIVQEDITERRRDEQFFQLAASVFTHAREGIVITDPAGQILDVNDAFSEITGYSREEAIGRNPRILQSGRHGRQFFQEMWSALYDTGQWSGEIWNRRKNGEIYTEAKTISAVHDLDGSIQHFVALFTDISTQKQQQAQLEHIAHYDALTGLPNRVLLADRMRQAMAHARRSNSRLAVIYLDLDGFKEINDKFGHETGDQLLVALTGYMREMVREADTLARLGGDEFVAVLSGLHENNDAVPMLKRLLASASRPVHIGDKPLQVSASLGVALYPLDDGEEVDAEQLLRRADQAMYQAKLAGKNRYQIFDVEKDRSDRGQLEGVERIREALTAEEFVLYYQPKVNMRTGELVGSEALIRWEHPQRGLLSPARFLPVIEEHPLSVDLGEWVLNAALSQMQRWREDGLEINVSVNISGRHLQQVNFVDRLRDLLAMYPKVDTKQLQLEILETSALEDIEQVSRIMSACNNMGVGFALDDFGTGYSSLTYLKRLPAAQLKIDRSFVGDMLDDPEDLAILEGILGLAAAFRRETIAEGVETIEHGELLLQLGCELAQGYAIAHPLPASEFPDWSKAWVPDQSWITARTFHRDELPKVFATVEHRAWVRGIESYLIDASSAPPPLDHLECRFGQWLDTMGRSKYGESSAFEALEAIHNEVHQYSQNLIRLKEEGKLGESSEKLSELRKISEKLTSSIEQLL